MAKTNKRVSEIPVDDDAAAPHLSGDTTAEDADRERIAERAHEPYMERGGSGGRALDDWLEAERELVRTRHPQNRSKAPDSAA